MKEKYLYLIKKFDTKKLAKLVSIIFILTLCPIIYVGLHNYPTGDDYWYGVHTYRGWLEDGLLGALKGSFLTVAEFYENWQGTWFTLFLFTLSPNHFVEGGYVITVFLALGCLIGGYAYLGNFYLCKKIGFSKSENTIIVCLISYLSLQYIPRTTSGIYWFNGIMHYSVPFLLAIFAVVHSHKFIDEKKSKDYIISFICFWLLGGGSYLAPLAATMAVGLILVYQLEIQKCDIRNRKIILKYDWTNFWILLAILVEFVGLVISFLAPGNSVRGGEEFGADLKWALQCVYYAIDRGIYLGEDYFSKNPVTTIVYIVLAVFLWNCVWKAKHKKRIKFRFPLLFVIYMNGIYWAIYTPEIYSRSDVSGGVPNTYFHVFLIITLANMVYVHGWVQKQIEKLWRKKTEKTAKNFEATCKKSFLYGEKYKAYICIPVAIVGCVMFCMASRHSGILTTNDYCIKCICDGTLEKYVQVREEQHVILMNTEELDVIVPEINAPYPLLNMVLSDLANQSRNIDRALYYNKTSIRAEKIE